jgi:membrane fusion protein (multidrug efflux system)
MKIKYIIYLIIVLLLAYLIYNRISKNKETKGSNISKAGPSAMKVDGIIVKEEDFSNVISLSGTLEADEQVQIKSEISGLVRTINFNEGSYVSKNSLLIKIDDRELQAQLSQALTKEKLASEIEDRSSKLLKSEAISQEEYDNVSAELRSLQSQTQLIRAQLSKTEIRAPFSGKIGLRSISPGSYITPNTEIANLININPIKINFSIPEKYSQRVKVGTEITFTVAGKNNTHKAKIYAVEPAINISTRTLILKAKADNSNGDLLPGAFANINLQLEKISNAILVPSQAVIPVLEGKQVFLLKNGKAKTVLIESDARTDKNVIVDKGLIAGDTLITTGMMGLKENTPVQVTLTDK